jgi:hypothetical protein
MLIVGLAALGAGTVNAGVLFETDGLSGGWRWDAAPREINGNERSLDGGLRYSLQGGSFADYRDLFEWTSVPSVESFQEAVELAFAAWTTVDPTTGLHAAFSFALDLETPVAGSGSFLGLNLNGAEIDLLAEDSGETRRHAVTNLNEIHQPVTLTSGTANYAGTEAIAGVDVTLNNNSSARYSLDLFRRLLAHEIGHALGLHDVEQAAEEPLFIDDNLDVTSSDAIKETINNSWALQVNPFDPADSPLSLYVLPEGNPGNDSDGVNLLMESKGLGIAGGNPVTNLVPLTNDEFSTRQFLYPSLERDLAVTGDYNGNGIVDAADYVVWRDTFGETVLWKGDGADGDQSGEIDLGDYEFWKQRFGELITAPSVTATTVPEPAAGWLIASAAAVAFAPPSRVACLRRRPA